MAYGSKEFKRPANATPEVKTMKREHAKGGEKSIPPMPGKQHHEAHGGDMYRGGTQHGGTCYTHDREDGVMDYQK